MGHQRHCLNGHTVGQDAPRPIHWHRLMPPSNLRKALRIDCP